MPAPGFPSDWWTATVRTVLPQRGALANARAAVQHDRWAADQRRNAALAVAEAAGHPSALPLQPHLGTASRQGQSDSQGARGLVLGEEDRPRVADVAPHAGFVAAAEDALALLHERLGLDLWLVTTVLGEQEVVLAARGVAGMPVPAGAVQPWAESYCRLMVCGQAPRVAPRAREVPAYAACSATQRFGIGAYIGVPLLAADGTLFGTVCGLAAEEQPDALVEGLADVERVARLLGTVLAKEAAALERSQAAADAYALAERDPLTGLLNCRGWLSRLAVEEQRCSRHSRSAAVLVLDLNSSVPPAGTGRPVPDRQLQAASRLLQRTCRSTDVLAHPGAAEFSVLAVECHPPHAAHLAERLRELFHDAGLLPAIEVASHANTRTLTQAWDDARTQVGTRPAHNRTPH